MTSMETRHQPANSMYAETTTTFQVEVAVRPRTATTADWRSRASCRPSRLGPFSDQFTPDVFVPESEGALVPYVIRSLCRRCPVRTECFADAIAEGDEGYRAATTTADRQAYNPFTDPDMYLREVDIKTCAEDRPLPLHAPGAGSLHWYKKRGCRCDECGEANMLAKRKERA